MVESCISVVITVGFVSVTVKGSKLLCNKDNV